MHAVITLFSRGLTMQPAVITLFSRGLTMQPMHAVITLFSRGLTPLCNSIGWGKTIYKGKMALRLREVEVPPVSRAKCAVRLAKSPGKVQRNYLTYQFSQQ